MKNLFIILLLVLYKINAIAGPCLDRHEMSSYSIVSDTEIDVYTQGTTIKIHTGPCSRPPVGEYNLSFQSLSGNVSAVCPGDRVVIYADNVTYSQCQILSIQ